MNSQNTRKKYAITICLFLCLYYALPAQEYSKKYGCNQYVDYTPSSESYNPPMARARSAAGCKRVKVYYIKPADYPYNEDRVKYCDIAIREIQQQWASQGRTAYFEKMEYVETNYTIADIESDYFVFCIDNILIPRFGRADGNYKVMFWVDGVFSPCCAAGGGDYAGAPGCSRLNWTRARSCLWYFP